MTSSGLFGNGCQASTTCEGKQKHAWHSAAQNPNAAHTQRKKTGTKMKNKRGRTCKPSSHVNTSSLESSTAFSTRSHREDRATTDRNHSKLHTSCRPNVYGAMTARDTRNLQQHNTGCTRVNTARDRQLSCMGRGGSQGHLDSQRNESKKHPSMLGGGVRGKGGASLRAGEHKTGETGHLASGPSVKCSQDNSTTKYGSQGRSSFTGRANTVSTAQRRTCGHVNQQKTMATPTKRGELQAGSGYRGSKVARPWLGGGGWETKNLHAC
jgi:hypothetical protein